MNDGPTIEIRVHIATEVHHIDRDIAKPLTCITRPIVDRNGLKFLTRGQEHLPGGVRIRAGRMGEVGERVDGRP